MLCYQIVHISPRQFPPRGFLGLCRKSMCSTLIVLRKGNVSFMNYRFFPLLGAKCINEKNMVDANTHIHDELAFIYLCIVTSESSGCANLHFIQQHFTDPVWLQQIYSFAGIYSCMVPSGRRIKHLYSCISTPKHPLPRIHSCIKSMP